MNDRHTRQALDAIADLLLTGPVEHALPPVDAPAAMPGSNSAPNLRLSAPHFDEPEPVAPPTVEALLLGHLPGYANPWISQYAQHAAMRRSPAALLRVEAASVELEIFGDDNSDWRPPVPPGPGGSSIRLAQILGELRDQVTTWILAAGSPVAPAVRQHMARADRWTLLTGADDAAVVGAYRLLKSMLEADAAPSPSALNPEPRTLKPSAPSIGIMMMGCEEDAARAALERISRASAAFLNSPIELVGHRPKMLPIRRFYLGRFEAESPAALWSQLQRYFDEIRPNRIHSPAPEAHGLKSVGPLSPDSPTQLTDEEITALTQSLDQEITEALDSTSLEAAPFSRDPKPAQGSASPNPAPSLKPGGAVPRSAAAIPAPSPSSPTPDSRSPIPSTSPDLNNLTSLIPSLTPLRARCPRQPKIQLAADAQGSLHLLLAAQGEPVDSALKKLAEVRAWSVEHRELLALASPNLIIASEADPVPHLFTDQPRLAADLAFSGPTNHRPLRLHLLKSIILAGTTHLVHEELT